MKTFLSLIVIVFMLSFTASADDLYGRYNFYSNYNPTVEPGFPGNFSTFSGNGVSLSINNQTLETENWTTGGYVYFTVTLWPGYNFNGVSLRLEFQMKRASDGPRNAEVNYKFGSSSLQSLGTWSPTTTMTTYSFDLPTPLPLEQNVLEIRFYAWNFYECVRGAFFDKIKLYGNSFPLPVELTSFTANVINKQVVLNWQTATETENYGFDIEKASSRGWEKIEFVNGSGNSNSLKSYSFTDKTVSSGIYTYRLKQIDANGGYFYSKEVEVDLGVPTAFTLAQNYPNPFNPTTVISYQVPTQSAVQIDVFNSIGEIVGTLVNEVKEAGYYDVEFNAASLTSGIYFYKIQAGNFISVKKMMLLK